MNRGLVLSVAFVGVLLANAAAEAATSVVTKRLSVTEYCGTAGSNYLVGAASSYTVDPIDFTITHSNSSNAMTVTMTNPNPLIFIAPDVLAITLKGYGFRNALKTRVVRYAMTGHPPAGSTFYGGVDATGVFMSIQGTGTIVAGALTDLTGSFIVERIDDLATTKRCVGYGTLVP